MTPTTVVFDLGKVLVDFDWTIAARRIATRSAVAATDMMKVFDYSHIVVEFELGKLSPEEFFERARKQIGFNGSFAEFAEMFSDIFTEIPIMVDLHATLRRRGVPTYIFSNTNVLAADFIGKQFPFYRQMDGYILSYQHGVMKPDAKLYEVVERLTARRGAEILYIDDRLENVEAGAARGWQVIHQTSPEKTVAACKQLGLLG
jgi:HAD superfamily hydrolase (TIGR01509 family)